MGFSDLLSVVDRNVRQKLGGSIVYTPGVGAPVSVEGIFDAAYVRVEAGEPGVSSTAPAVFLALADLPSNPLDDEEARLTIAGTTYRVHEPKPDGLGGVLLLLHEV